MSLRQTGPRGYLSAVGKGMEISKRRLNISLNMSILL